MNNLHALIYLTLLCLLLSGVLQAQAPDTAGFSSLSLKEANVVADKWHREGLNLKRGFRYSEAIVHYEMAIYLRQQIITKLSPSTDRNIVENSLEGLVKSVNNLGTVYKDSYDYQRAEEYFLECLAVQDQLEKNWNFEVLKRRAWANDNLANVYKNSKGLEESLQKFDQAYFYYELMEDKEGVASIHNDISALYLDWKEPDSAIHYIHKVIPTYQEKEWFYELGLAFQNLGVAYYSKKEYAKGEEAYKESIAYFSEEDTQKNSTKLSELFGNLAWVYLGQGEFDLAKQTIDKAFEYNREDYRNYNPILAATNFHIKGEILLGQSLPDTAIKNFNEAINLLLHKRLNKKLSNIFAYLDNNTADLGPKTKKDLLLIGDLYARALIEKGQVDEALKTYQVAINFLNQSRRSYRDNKSKFQLASIAKNIYEGAIQTAILAQQPELAFQFSENSKAFTLLEGIRHQKAFSISGIDEGLLRLEQDLTVEINSLEQEQVRVDSLELKISLGKEIEDRRKELEILKKNLEQNPAYQKLVLEQEALSLETLQQEVLAKNQVLVEYFVGEEKTYVFVIPPKGAIKIHTLSLPAETIDTWVEPIFNGIYHGRIAGMDYFSEELQQQYTLSELKEQLNLEYVEKAQWLYDSLLAPVVAQFPSKRIVLIPDGSLNTIPFEALLMGQPERLKRFDQYPYFGKDHVLSYCYSATLLKEMQESPVSANSQGKLLAIAPSFAADGIAMTQSGFEQLLRSKEVIQYIYETYKERCDTLLNGSATKTRFLDLMKSGAYQWLHLSTHGKANDQDPNFSYISFTQSKSQVIDQDQLLYVRDLYTLRLPLDMVFLSACETNKGTLKKGEGIMSFTRGLAFAGARSIISTLWAVNADASTQLTQSFYQQLEEHPSKDIALHEAKLELMQKGSTAHPYFWAGFLAIGAVGEEEPSNNWWWWIGGGILLLLLSYFLEKNRRFFSKK